MSGFGEEQEGEGFAKQIGGVRKRARRSEKRRVRQLKKTWGHAFTILCLVALVAFVATGVWFWNAGQEADGENGELDAPIVLEWHEGGTLHQATLRTWRAAGYRDRLATSADLLSLYMELSRWPHLRNRPDRGEFREMAEALEAMIQQTGNVDRSVEEAAAASWALLEPDWR
jgi:hypothetical protein